MLYLIITRKRDNTEWTFPFFVDYNERFSERSIYPTQNIFGVESFRDLFMFLEYAKGYVMRDTKEYIDSQNFEIRIDGCKPCEENDYNLFKFSDIMFMNKILKGDLDEN